MDPDSNPRSPDFVWNIATVFILALIPMIMAVFLLIFLNPQSSLNPLPPPTLPPLAEQFTGTPMPLMMPPTWTATPTITLTPADTLIPSQTPVPSATPLVIAGTPMDELPGEAPTETAVPGGYTFNPQSDPQAISASLYDGNRGCTWMGVAGRVFDIQGRPVTGIRIFLNGYLDGKTVQLSSLSGTAAQYGPSGFEFTLSNTLIASNDALGIRLMDQADVPLSARITFDTFEDCSKNLILVDFKAVR